MSPKKLKARRARVRQLNRALKKLFPHAAIELNYKNPLQLLVAVQLSAQCTDKQVNKITATLFKKYRTLGSYLEAKPREFERDIKSSGFYRAKTKNILGAVKMIKEEFNGRVPKTIDELLRLPGVARKTATVVLSEAYGVVAGITVDTHVIRFVQRYDLSDSTNPIKIERDLMQILPKKEWAHFTHRVIHYGRYVAPARRYNTSKDPLVKIYPPAGKRFRVWYTGSMAYDFKPFEKRIKEIEERAGKELSSIRTGRAAPAILDGIVVESYGTRMPIIQLASVSVEDARTLRISPYDQGNSKEIEKAITQANLGLSVGADERGVRVSFPELTSERREGLVKLAKEKVEESKASLRQARDEVWSDIQKKEKDSTISEDDKFRYKDEMQKRVDDMNKKLDDMLERKEKEISA